MKQQRLIIVGLGLMSVVLLGAVACSPLGEAHAVGGSPAPDAAQPVSPTPMDESPSCANPTAEREADCRAMAERLLAMTVRVEFLTAHEISRGHATVVDGRYLITHNHYPIAETCTRNEGGCDVTAISLFKANGEIILANAPLQSVAFDLVSPETLVLDFGDLGGQGLFDVLGLPSAEIGTGESLNVTPGSEVAQVDWNGTTAHVDWSRVKSIGVDGVTPYMELDTFVEHGASGGGVFYNGVHIANNWTRCTDVAAADGEISSQFSVAALNPPAFNGIVEPALATGY